MHETAVHLEGAQTRDVLVAGQRSYHLAATPKIVLLLLQKGPVCTRAKLAVTLLSWNKQKQRRRRRTGSCL